MGLGTHSVINLTLLLLSSINGTTSNTFHIVTSLDAPCPGEFIGDPCVTLQQYVSNPSISSDNITLLFESGNHTITSTLSSSNANNFTMSGYNVEIQCSSSAIQITLTSVQHVHISGVSFIGCGSSTLGTNGRSVHLESISFLRSGGITVRNMLHGVNITDVIFSSGAVTISSARQLSMEDCALQYIQSTSPALTLSHITMINIIRSDISNNQRDSRYFSSRRGTIHIESSGSESVLNIVNSSFHNNTVYQNGGAIYVVQTNVTINGSIFRNNSANWNGYSYPYGGAVYMSGTGKSLTVFNTTFLMNTASESGGAIYVQGTTVTAMECNFKSNTAATGSGGAMYVQGATVTAMECNFTLNTAIHYYYGNGGAIYMSGTNKFFVVINTTFLMNRAGGSGGAMYVQGATVTTTGCNFTSNTVTYFVGGAMYVQGAIVKIVKCNYTMNSASYAGGATYTSGPHHEINDSRFITNRAGSRGGGCLL